MSDFIPISYRLNDELFDAVVPAQELLIDLLRDRHALTGTKRSCDVQVCGACTVLVDDRPISSCCTLAADVDSRSITTIEGFSASPAFRLFEAAFVRHAAVQCGFCTPGFVLTLEASRRSGEISSMDDLRNALAGNLCRCTGYASLIAAAAEALSVTK
jgi:carbon-monoxide dehydrogenase small subunit